MPRRAKGPRLYLRTGRRDGRTGKPLPDVWVIRDGAHEQSTGCGPDRLPEAEIDLAGYIATKWAEGDGDPERDPHDPRQVSIAEVLTRYAEKRAPNLATDPKTSAGFIGHLLAWWGDKMLNEIGEDNCEAYIAHRTAQPISRFKDAEAAPRVTPQSAARELDVLSAAVGTWHKQWALTFRPLVSKPPAPESPRDALTRSQAAALLKASLGYRRTPDGRWERLQASSRANRAHLRRFVLIGLYTGTRHSAMRALLWEESLHQAWVDLDKGMIYRRGRGERETTKRRPVVKLPRRLLAHMRRWRALDLLKAAAKTNTSGEPVRNAYTSVLHHGGEPIAGKIRTGFENCVRDAGLPPEVTPHYMRHTAATWLMENGVEAWEAAAYLGMTPQTLIEHYGHHRPDHQAGAVRAIGGKR